MERRRFLVLLAAGLAGAATARGAGELIAGEPGKGTAASPKALLRAVPRNVADARPAAATRPPSPFGPPIPPPAGVVTALPGTGPFLALTVDDGVSSEVVAGYLRLARDTGVRLTFFPNGCYRSWQENARVLRPLLESGQVAVGNHTWSHPDVTKLSDRDVAAQITRNQDFLRRTLGVRETPFFRPPFGAHSARTDRIAADLGHPTIAMWDGTLGDDRILTGSQIVTYAQRWFAAQRIVIGHANHPAVTTVYGQLLDLLSTRGLRTVTLADVWATPPGR